MNKEELIGKLQMVYIGDRNALNELIGYYDGLKEVIEILQQENNQLKENLKLEKQISNSIAKDYEILLNQKKELRSWLEEEIKEEYRLHKEFLRIGVIKGETKLTSQFKRVLSKLNELEKKSAESGKNIQ